MGMPKGWRTCASCGQARRAADFLGENGRRCKCCQVCRDKQHTYQSKKRKKMLAAAGNGYRVCIHCGKKWEEALFLGSQGRILKTCEICRNRRKRRYYNNDEESVAADDKDVLRKLESMGEGARADAYQLLGCPDGFSVKPARWRDRDRARGVRWFQIV